ncbi:hypothetical protein BS78_05G044400 [Paspalum vaginatum]|nr:hypothetical protein BS78_05G044400 [Paspalum vaginatum]
MLSNKSIQEITVLNLGHKTSTGFPVEELQDGRLSALSIGFMTLPDLDLSCFNYSALQVLCLFSCTFEGLKLGWIITDCVSLRELRVGFPTENLKINSKSLEMVVVWGTKASWLVIEYAPKLDVLMTSIFPREGDARVKPKRSHPTVSISINNADSLREVNYLLLQYHIITVNSVPISKKYVPWNSVKNLKLGLNVSSAAQRDSLRKILDSVPMLLELCIRRMDDIGRDEGFDMIIDCPFEDLNHVTCVTTCLSRFSVEEFRGGAAELHMIKCVLRHAPHLLELCTTHC